MLKSGKQVQNVTKTFGHEAKKNILKTVYTQGRLWLSSEKKGRERGGSWLYYPNQPTVKLHNTTQELQEAQDQPTFS